MYQMKLKKVFALLLALCLCAGLLPAAYAAVEDGEAELAEYMVGGVGIFYLPAGWALDMGAVEEPLPQTYAEFTNGDIRIHSNCFGADAYEAAGVPLPADVEEFSQRAGVRQGLPEGAEFAYDDFGNYYTEYTREDGTAVYYVLKQGENCMGDAVLTYPEGTELPENIYLWLSKIVIDASLEALRRYDAEGVGVLYLPSDWEMEVTSREEPLPQTLAELNCGDLHITFIRNGIDAYEAAGVPLPADVEEYSQRDGVRKDLPEGVEFAYDGFGNFYAEYTQDGTVTYNVLKQGEESMGSLFLTYPEGTELPEDIYLWLSLAVIE